MIINTVLNFIRWCVSLGVVDNKVTLLSFNVLKDYKYSTTPSAVPTATPTATPVLLMKV